VNQKTLPAAVKARVMEAAHHETSPTRQSVTVDTLLLLLTGAAVAMNLFLAAGGANLARRSMALVVTTALGRGTIALASTWASLARGGSMLGRSLRWLIAATIATPVAISGWLLLAARAAPSGEPVNDWHCLTTAILLGVGPLAAFALMHRQSDVSHPLATGAALGAAAGAWADFLMVLHCPAPEFGHHLLCHLAPTAALVALGAVWGALGVRSSPRCDHVETNRPVVRIPGDWSERG
jgi:hypothetical protein